MSTCRKTPATLALTLLALVMPVLAGCDAIDSDRRADDWHPTGANAGNLAAMVVRPSDLISGRSAGGADARTLVDAVERVRTDHPKALMNVSPTSSGGTSGQN
jgi:type IV pilus biogenesis protein CpaD/CtpE